MFNIKEICLTCNSEKQQRQYGGCQGLRDGRNGGDARRWGNGKKSKSINFQFKSFKFQGCNVQHVGYS